MLNLEAKGMPKNGNLDLENLIKAERWIILNKEFGTTYLCNRLSHRQFGMEERWLWVVAQGKLLRIPSYAACTGTG